MPLFKKSISEKLNLDLINFADNEKENLAKKTLYLRSDAEREQRNLSVIGLSTGVSTTIAFGSMLAYVTNTLPLDAVQSAAQIGIIPAVATFAATPLMNLYDKMKDGLCKISGDKLKSVNDYEYDYQKLSLFKERIADKLETPIIKENQYITADEIKREGREYMYNAFATGVVGTMLAAGLSNEFTNALPAESVETIMTAGLYSLPLYAVSPLLNLIDKCKENYSKVTASLRANADLANEIDTGLERTVFAAPLMTTNQLDVGLTNKVTLNNELPAKQPEVPMIQDGLMDKADYLQLLSDVRKSYAALLPEPTVEPMKLTDNNYFIEAEIEQEINLAIENSNVKVNMPSANVIEVPYVKDDLKKPLFIDALVKEEKEIKPEPVSVVESNELSKDDLLNFVSKINETYKPLPEPKGRQIPKEVFIFDEPEMKEKPIGEINAKRDVNSELSMVIPKELDGLTARRMDDALPVLEIHDNGFKVKAGDNVKQFFKNQILKQQAELNNSPEKLVTNKQERVKPRMSV